LVLVETLIPSETSVSASPDQAAVHFHHASVTRLNWSELRVIADVGNRTARPVDQIDKMLVGSHFLKNAVNRNLGHSFVLRTTLASPVPVAGAFATE
jgi:hypothetical protein